jgi:integrase
MRTTIKGIKTTRKKLANGTVKTYYYERYSNTPLPGKPGSREFMDAYHRAVKSSPIKGTFARLISAYQESPEFAALAPKTRTDYSYYIKLILEKFGDLPIEALNAPQIRVQFKAWRNTMSVTPRKADLAWSVLRLILAWAVDQVLIKHNAALGGKRLHRTTRADIIWTQEDLQKAFDHFPRHVLDALVLALHTGQRQGDLLRMTWANHQNGVIYVTQGKTGAKVAIPTTRLLTRRLDLMPRTATTILTNSRGLPWSIDGFRSSWDTAKKKAGIEGLTFHDLRGTAITRLHLAGCSNAEIASISGHKISQVGKILDTYIAVSGHLAVSAIEKLDKAES